MGSNSVSYIVKGIRDVAKGKGGDGAEPDPHVK